MSQYVDEPKLTSLHVKPPSVDASTVPLRPHAQPLDVSGNETESSVLVTGVEPLSPASRAGLRRGDVILAVQGKEVSSAEQFETVMKKADLEEGVRLHVRRGDGKLFFVVKAEEGDLRG